jgi:hypothetical protein
VTPAAPQAVAAAYREEIERLLAATFAAYEAQEEWTAQLRAALETLLGLLAAEPAVARLCFVDVLAGGAAAIEARDEATQRLAGLFGAGARGRDGAPSELLRLALAGGLSEVIYREVVAGRTAELPERLEDLLYMSVLPLRGIEAAEAAVTDAEPEPLGE